ncbi:MAG: tRNA preQ1(34) S-adenosylmethionine ribosyltransferase-isomerase QueA [Alphaproteobacteria bacterium]|nr:tRNA preQ1(34) S-adenosylmethionine ribosyltransferase-isomerase QueA [Alphaproteobacteria bacterium]
MRVADFDFDLPEELIALRPASPRDSARLLIVREGSATFEEAAVRDLPSFLNAGDVCIFNDTRVIPAQLFGTRPARGDSAESAIDVTLHKREASDVWAAFAKPGRKLIAGDTICFGDRLAAVVEAKRDGGEIALRFDAFGAALDQAIAEVGVTPLPPYIAGRRAADERDQTDYQTIYAVRDGAVAAPTAGLHFTPELMAAIDAKDVKRETVTLHVGAGTFLPVKADHTKDHVMHAEWGEVTAATAASINEARAAGRRTLGVGTTSLRTIESASNAEVHAFKGDTRLFITPGYQFKSVDMLLTNFHLPRSTLFMLVSAFCGLDTMRAAYAHAIAHCFRFYSYGDACLLIRKSK